MTTFPKCPTHGYFVGRKCPRCREEAPAPRELNELEKWQKRSEPEPPKPPRFRQMNGTESRFAEILEFRLKAGEIKAWKYEPIRLKWGQAPDGTAMRYLADFAVFENDGKITLIETKGYHIHDRDLVRFRGCRAEWQHQFRFEMWQYVQKTGWKKKE